jgi:hypothetical protein
MCACLGCDDLHITKFLQGFGEFLGLDGGNASCDA